MSNMTQLTSEGVGRVFCGSIIFFWALSVSELDFARGARAGLLEG
jgi:hypothetical protein